MPKRINYLQKWIKEHPNECMIMVSRLPVEGSAHQTDAEIETAYNNQVGAMSQATAEAGSSTTIFSSLATGSNSYAQALN